MSLPTPGTAEYDASIPPEWRRPYGFMSPNTCHNEFPNHNNTTKETTMPTDITPIRNASVAYLEGEGWEADSINEYIEHVNSAAGTSWKPVAQERTLHITFTVTVEVEDVEIEDDNNVDVWDLGLLDYDDAVARGGVVASDYESVEVV